MIQYWGLRLVSFLLHKIPLSWGYALASFIGDLTFFLWRRGQRNMLANMAHVLGPETSKWAVARVARRSLRNYAKYMVDFVRFPGMSAEDIMKKVHMVEWERVEGSLRQGRGVIIVGLHLGNWDMGAAVGALQGTTVNVITESFPNKRMDEFVQGTRQHTGVRVIPMERLRLMVKALHNNEILAILIDRPLSGDAGVPVRFFGGETRVPGGPAVLALRTGAKLVTASMARLADDSFLLSIDEPIPFPSTGDLERDVQILTQRIMDALEVTVRRYPDQWFMFRPMWPSAPERALTPSRA